jgi:hypothetical protein
MLEIIMLLLLLNDDVLSVDGRCVYFRIYNVFGTLMSYFFTSGQAAYAAHANHLLAADFHPLF